METDISPETHYVYVRQWTNSKGIRALLRSWKLRNIEACRFQFTISRLQSKFNANVIYASVWGPIVRGPRTWGCISEFHKLSSSFLVRFLACKFPTQVLYIHKRLVCNSMQISLYPCLFYLSMLSSFICNHLLPVELQNII
jgi:hypothetical protein